VNGFTPGPPFYFSASFAIPNPHTALTIGDCRLGYLRGRIAFIEDCLVFPVALPEPR